ncbi:hypothetical protein EV714DRAFT_214814 [Schizophyllum commune]
MSLSPESPVPLINQLPSELLTKVFEKCIEHIIGNLTYHEAASMLGPEYPSLVVSHVCRRWRDIALDSPVLWQWFSIRPCRDRSHQRLASLFAARARGTGLHIRAVGDKDEEMRGAGFEPCTCALDFIVRHTPAIVELELDDPSENTANNLWQRTSPSLKRFALTIGWVPATPRVVELLSSTFLMRGVHDLHWESATFAPELVNWTNMRSLRLERADIDRRTFLRIVSSAPALRYLQIRVTNSPLGESFAHPAAPYRLDALEELEMHGNGSQDELFRDLHTPWLRRFSLEIDDNLGNEEGSYHGWPLADIAVLLDFLRRTQGTMERLALRGGQTLDESAVLRIIEMPQMSALKILRIQRVAGDVGDAAFAKLGPEGRDDEGRALLPHLERLTLFTCRTTDGVMSRMMEFRREQGYPLVMLRVKYSPGVYGPSPIDLASFEALNKLDRWIMW